MANGPHRVVIIGGGFGGLKAAHQLKRAPVQLVLIDRRNFHLFQPLLYQVATGGLSPANIASPIRSVLRRHRNARVLLGEVTDIDAANRRVLYGHGTLDYDTLIVATGVGHQYFGHDQWERLAPGLKTIEDARKIRSRILVAFEEAECEPDEAKRRSWITFIVVGGGPTGVELAGAVGELARHTLRHEYHMFNPADARVLLVEGTDRVLPTFPPTLSARAAESLARLGVTVRTNTLVSDVQPGSVTLRYEDHTETVAARTVLWAAGVQASPLGQVLARSAGATLDGAGRVRVQPDLTLPGHPEIFVVGDLAHLEEGDRQLPGVAQVALQQGRYAADLIQRRLKGQTLPPFHYHDHGNMATIGRNAAVADMGWLRLSGLIGWLAWLFIHLMFLAQFHNRLLVLTQWAWSYVTRNRAARLITAEEAGER